MTASVQVDDVQSCPSIDTIVAVVERVLPHADFDAVERHLDACSACRRLVAELVLEDSADRGEPDDEIRPGRRLGPLVVLGPLGEGGMGQVVLAHDTRLDRNVAVKVVHPHLFETAAPGGSVAAGETFRARLVDEARAAARLVHENIVIVLDVGRDGDDVWIAFEWVDGVSLDRWLATPRSWRVIVRTFVEAGRGLAAAHDAEIIHRDFKPANVLVGDDGRVRVADFGLAIDLGGGADVEASIRDHEPTTTHGDPPRRSTLAGTPAYFAPELLDGATADPRSDQYAYFASLWQALTGLRPDPHHAPAVRAAALGQVPRRLRRVVLRGLAPTPLDRFADMHAAVAALERATQPWPGLAAIGLTVVALTAVVWAMRAPERAPCTARIDALTTVWNPAAAARAYDSIAAENPVLGQRIVQSLGEWSSTWAENVRNSCALLDDAPTIAATRLSCLERQRARFSTIVDSVREASDDPTGRARWGLRMLAGTETCAALTQADASVASEADVARNGELVALAARLRFDEAAGAAAAVASLAVIEAQIDGDVRGGLEAGVELGRALLDGGSHDAAIERLAALHYEALAAGVDDIAATTAIVLVGALGRDAHRFDEAETWAGHARAALERLAPEVAARSRANLAERLGSMAAERHRYADAFALHDEALRYARTVGDIDGIFENLRNRGHALRNLGRVDEALADYRASIATATAALGAEHPWIASAELGVAAVLLERGEPKAAVPVIERAREALARTHGPDHPDVAVAQSYLGEALSDVGDARAALAAYREALRIDGLVYGDRHGNVAISHNNVAEVLQEIGDLAGAKREYEIALDIKTSVYAPDHPSLMVAHDNLGVVLERLGEPGALAHYEAALAIARRALEPDDPRWVSVLQNLAEYHREHGAPATARPLYERVLAMMTARHGADDPRLAYPLTGLAQLELVEGDTEAALGLAEQALRLRAEQPEALRSFTALVVAEALHALGRAPRRVQAIAEQGVATLAGPDQARARALLDAH